MTGAIARPGAGRRLLVNELAPRPHNSGHLTFDCSVTGQFEQQLRAICGLPLGDTQLLAPAAAMANLLGDLWFAQPAGPDGSVGAGAGVGDERSGQPIEPDWAAALRDPRVKLHLYGKSTPRPGRKMGHLTATGASPQDARQRVLAAREALCARRP